MCCYIYFQVCILCLDKSKDMNNRFNNSKLQELFATHVYPNFYEKAQYLPDGICQTCKTVLYSQAYPEKKMKIKDQKDYAKLAKHLQFLTKQHPEDGEDGTCPCEVCRVGRRKGYDTKNNYSPYFTTEVASYKLLPNPKYLQSIDVTPASTQNQGDTHIQQDGPGFEPIEMNDHTFDDWGTVDDDDEEEDLVDLQQPGTSSQTATLVYPGSSSKHPSSLRSLNVGHRLVI